jgi:excisionase family DNA binding protein
MGLEDAESSETRWSMRGTMTDKAAMSAPEAVKATFPSSQSECHPGVRASPWLTVKEAGTRARCGVKTIYREVKAGHLRAARVGGRRELRFLPEWVDAWLCMTVR